MMKSSSILFWSLQLFITSASSSFDWSRWSKAPTNVLHSRDQGDSNSTALVKISERSADQIFYDISFGTPAQEIKLAIQSQCLFGTWVMYNNTNFTSGHQFGYPSTLDKPYMFDYDASTSAGNASGTISSRQYFPVTDVEGGEFVDKISLEGISLGRREMYLMEESNRAPGDVCMTDMASWLRNQSAVEEEVFSIWLNGDESTPGEVTFGGVDTKKYEGDLFLLPASDRLVGFDPNRKISSLQAFTVTDDNMDMKSMLNKSAASFEMNHGVLVSSFPPGAANLLYFLIGDVYSINGIYDIPGVLVPCSKAESSFNFNFIFGYENAFTSVSLPLSALMSTAKLAQLAINYSDFRFSSEDNLCLLYVLPDTDNDFFVNEHSVFVLGSSVLKHIVALFDNPGSRMGVASALSSITNSNPIRYKDGCFSGARHATSGASFSCSQTASVLSSQILTNTPTAILPTDTPNIAAPSNSSNDTSAAPRYRAYPVVVLVVFVLLYISS